MNISCLHHGWPLEPTYGSEEQPYVKHITVTKPCSLEERKRGIVFSSSKLMALPVGGGLSFGKMMQFLNMSATKLTSMCFMSLYSNGLS